MPNTFVRAWRRLVMLVLTALVVSSCNFSCPSQQPRNLAMFSGANQPCYDRKTQPSTSVVDSHFHGRPFGTHAIPLPELSDYFRRLGVLFVNLYGIGQVLPIDSKCDYYGDCPGVAVKPSLTNDFRNVSNILDYQPEDIRFTLSMSFPDLSKPAEVEKNMALLDQEYPKQFKWMGELNLVKQALFANGHQATPREKIAEWQPFMAILKQRNMPLSLHADLGHDGEPTQYLPLIEETLALYPDNDIVWVHMGLSKELTKMPADWHIRLMKRLLDAYPRLMLDISWRVLYDHYFAVEENQQQYVKFFNQYADRVLTGTDFVASRKKNFDDYAEEHEVTSRINRHLDDNAFRLIALGGNYFRLLKLDQFNAPDICTNTSH